MYDLKKAAGLISKLFSLRFEFLKIGYTSAFIVTSDCLCPFSFHRGWTGVSSLRDNSGRPFAVTWSPPRSGWAGLKRPTDRQTNRFIISYVRACLLHLALPPDRWIPLLVSLPCLKASWGVEWPCMQKILWRRRDGEKVKDDDKCLALWKKDLKNPNWRQGGRPGHIFTKPHWCCC